MTPITERIARERRQRAINMAEAGKTAEEIAAEMGITITIARIWADPRRRHDRVPRPKYFNEVTQMKAMRKAGMQDIEIAKHFGVSKQTVNSRLGPRQDRKPKSDTIVRMRMRESSHQRLKAIAREFGLLAGVGRDAKEGSVPFLLEAIAVGDLQLVPVKRERPKR